MTIENIRSTITRAEAIARESGEASRGGDLETRYELAKLVIDDLAELAELHLESVAGPGAGYTARLRRQRLELAIRRARAARSLMGL